MRRDVSQLSVNKAMTWCGRGCSFLGLSPCDSLVDFPVFTMGYLLTVGDLYSSSTDNSVILTQEATEVAFRDLRRKTDNISDGETSAVPFMGKRWVPT